MKPTTLTAGLCSMLLLGALTATAADKVDVSKIPAASPKKGLTYDKDIKSILEEGCAKCHGAEKQKGKYRVDSLAAVIKGGESGDPAIKPGKATESLLIHYMSYLVEDMEMPPKDKEGKSRKLSDEKIGLIRAWIDQGAK